MSKKTSAFTLLLLLLLPASAFSMSDNCGDGAWCGCPGETQCLGNYSTCEEACGLVDSYSPPARDYAAEAAAQARYEREVAGNAINDLGLEAWNRGDVRAAADYFGQALEKKPDDEVIRQNMNKALTRIAQEEAKKIARQQMLLEKEAENIVIDRDIQNVVSGFTLPDAFGTKKADPGLRFGDASEDTGAKVRFWLNELSHLKFIRPESKARSAQISKDPRMVDAEGELTRLKAERDRMALEIDQLKKKAVATSDPALKKELKEELAQMDQNKKEKTSEINKTEETKKKLHRTINTEIEKKEKA